jgi:hypothetical protein
MVCVCASGVATKGRQWRRRRREGVRGEGEFSERKRAVV